MKYQQKLTQEEKKKLRDDDFVDRVSSRGWDNPYSSVGRRGRCRYCPWSNADGDCFAGSCMSGDVRRKRSWARGVGRSDIL